MLIMENPPRKKKSSKENKGCLYTLITISIIIVLIFLGLRQCSIMQWDQIRMTPNANSIENLRFALEKYASQTGNYPVGNYDLGAIEGTKLDKIMETITRTDYPEGHDWGFFEVGYIDVVSFHYESADGTSFKIAAKPNTPRKHIITATPSGVYVDGNPRWPLGE